MTAAAPDGVMLRVENLVKHFPVTEGIVLQRRVGEVKAVDGISFTVRAGETFALVGESGCGKSTTGRLVLRLIEPTAGRVTFQGRDVFGLSRRDLRALRAEMQIIFQDPYASLHPRMTVAEILGEPLEVHGIARGAAKRRRIEELLDVVGLSPWHMLRYPHEFSGGQRQRIGIARALAVAPKLIVCDEPVSALDVSIQAQIVNLLRDLQRRFGLAYILIAHDLAVVKHVSDRIAVMYLGKIVETAAKAELFARPRHPYTRALMSAIPVPDPQRPPARLILEGDVPSPHDPPVGCRFHTRCPFATERCRQDEPPFRDTGGGHRVACHHWQDIEAGQRRETPAAPAPAAGYRARLEAYRKALEARARGA